MNNIFLIAALASSLAAYAVPARPGMITATQPNGVKVALTLHGDEHFHYATTPEGLHLLPDSQGFWAFTRENDGRAVAGTVRYTGSESVKRAMAEKLGRMLPVRPEAVSGMKRAAAGDLQIDGTFPAKGKHNLLMLLINFADTETTFSQKDFDDYMNKPNYKGIGSFRDYYLENSYGLLDITTTVTRWVKLSKPKSSYGDNGVPNMIAEALQALDAELDLNDFDNDGDGILDGLAVIHQGVGQEASGNTADIWSHSSSIYGMEFDGVQVRRYTIQPEMLDKSISTIGVMCHEFGHNLGAPDFYDTDYDMGGGEFCGTGTWDLMGSGAWNGSLGDRPAGTNIWQKVQLGWVTPTQLSADAEVKNMKGATFNPVAYRFDTTVPGEYFIMENRQMEGNFDRAIPHHGLLIYHVNENLIAKGMEMNTLNVSYPQAIYTVCAGAGTDPNSSTASFGWVDSPECPFPGSDAVTSFSDTSLPSTRSISGRYSYRGLNDITENPDGTINFRFRMEQTPAMPRNLNAASKRGVVTLTWDAPEGEAPVRYNIYRNEQLLARVEQPRFIDISAGTYNMLTYEIDAEYSSGLISPSVTAELTIPRNYITVFSAGMVNDAIALNWNLDTRLSRTEGELSDLAVRDVICNKIEIAHRYRPEDLAIYKGYKIRRVAFLPAQPQRVLSVKVSVCKADPVSGELVTLQERAVSEYGVAQWNEITLPQSVEITGQDELWIVVTYESNNGTVQVVTDQGPVMNDMGCMERVDNGSWQPNTSRGGNYYIHAFLSEPAPVAGDKVDVEAGEVAMTDLAYPQGFAIYRDDELIATTNGRSWTDLLPEPGFHTYAVTNLYKGGNESVALEQTVDCGNVGISTPVVDGSVTIQEDGIRVAGPATVYDAAGRVVAVTAGEATVNLPQGVYLVTVNGLTTKVAVR